MDVLSTIFEAILKPVKYNTFKNVSQLQITHLYFYLYIYIHFSIIRKNCIIVSTRITRLTYTIQTNK